MSSVSNAIKSKDDARSPFAGASEADLKIKIANAGAAGMDKARDMASSAVDTAKDATSSVAHSVSDAGSAVGDKANEATSAVGGGMKSLAGSIRQHSPHDGVLGTASASVADSLESGGRYLQEEGLRGMADDITNLIRRNPVPALLIGIGIGFLLAKVTTRS